MCKEVVQRIDNIKSYNGMAEKSMDEITMQISLPTNASFHGNETSSPYWDQVTSIVLEVTMGIFILVGIVGNVLVLTVILKHKGMRTRTNAFLFALAIVDLLTAVFAMPVSLVTVISGGWVFGEAFCQFNGFFIPLTFVTSIHLLMYIGVHKYLTITRPFDAPLTKRHIALMMSAAWGWGAVIGFLNMYGLNQVYYKEFTTQCGPHYPHDIPTYMHMAIMVVTCYVVPMTVLVFTYSRIFGEIRAYSGRLDKHSDVVRKHIFGQQKRITVTLVLVLICFILCWTPYVVYSIYISSIEDKMKIDRNANAIVYWFGYMNSACNPVIYALHSPTFREGFRGVMCLDSAALDSDGTDSRGLIWRLRSFMNDNFVQRSTPRSSPCVSTVTLNCAQSGSKTTLIGQIKATSLPNVSKIAKSPVFTLLPHYKLGNKSKKKSPNSDKYGTVSLVQTKLGDEQNGQYYHAKDEVDHCATFLNETEMVSKRTSPLSPLIEISSDALDFPNVHERCSVTFNIETSQNERIIISAASSIDDVFSSGSFTSDRIPKCGVDRSIRNSSASTIGAHSEPQEIDSDGLTDCSSGSAYYRKSDNGIQVRKSKRRNRRYMGPKCVDLDAKTDSTVGLLDSSEFFNCSSNQRQRPWKRTTRQFSHVPRTSAMNEQNMETFARSKSEARLMSPKFLFQRMFSWNARTLHRHSSKSPQESVPSTLCTPEAKPNDSDMSKSCGSVLHRAMVSYPSIEKLHHKQKSRFKISSISVKYKRSSAKGHDIEKSRRFHRHRSKSDPCIYHS